MSSTTTTMEDKRFTKHGFPKGFRFVPTQLELITILSHKINGRRLHPKVAGIFHELTILDHHPKDLHDMYERDKEHRYIYFFSRRQFQKTAGGGGPVHKKRQRGAAGAGQDEDDNEPRPVRLARGGGWKPSGGGHVLHWPKDKGGFVAGKMVTMVFYDHRNNGQQVKSHWGMHEFTVPVHQQLLSEPTKTTHLHNLALYRLYRLKGDDMKSDDGAGSNQTLANVSAAHGHFSAPCPAGQPSSGILTGRNQPLATGATTSRMPPPPQLQQQQHHIPNVGHSQYYHHHQYAFGAAPARSAHQQVHTMAMPPPAYGTGMPGRHQLLQFARPPSTGLPGRQSFQQFARPPAPSQMPAPAKPATYCGAGQKASHSGATRSLPWAAVSTPPPAAESPSAEELAPLTATHGGAGQEASGNLGATRSWQDATATAETDCVKLEDKEIEDSIPADNYDGIGMPDYDLDLGWMLEDRFLFTMDDLCPTSDEPPPTQQGDSN
ncbi:hypothetical protein SORBI_3001G249800 [Sorghum bicolor]|uniref:NAC domain-containing protein n=1 Tax=Sorghum bicolor TaxID=4558 RepID=A0A1Z5S786_SORBI|nr:hypothetical protein SORBI_3001G249800 [Sorghum bicolor]